MEPSSILDRLPNGFLKRKKKKQECTATSTSNLVSNCLMVLPHQAPPFLPGGTRFAHKPFFLTTSASRILYDGRHSTATSSSAHIALHDFVASTFANCLRKLNGLVFQNPLLKNISYLSSRIHSFLRVPCGNRRNLNVLPSHNFAAILPGDSLGGIVVANGILNFLNIYNTLLVVRLVLTWFPNTPPAIVSPLSTLCDPYLNIFRGIIPPLGGTLDLSPILAFLVLNVFSSTAAALPAELPPLGSERTLSATTPPLSHHTTSNKKWMRRLASANRWPKNSSIDN